MADVFLSYAHADRQRAQELAKVLMEYGWTVFWDRVIRSGPRFRDVISKELESAKCVVVLWSRASVQSDWVIDEAEEARTSGRLVPAVLETVKPPHGFRGLQTSSLLNWTSGTADAEFDLLLDGIEAHAPRQRRASSSTFPGPESRIDTTRDRVTPATPDKGKDGGARRDESRTVDRHPALSIPTTASAFTVRTSPLETDVEAPVMPPAQLAHSSDIDVDTGTNLRTQGRDMRGLLMAVGALLLAGIIAATILKNSTVPNDLGFDPAGVVMMEVTLPAARYQTGLEVTKGFESLLERLRATPGVQAAAAVDVEPTRENPINSSLDIGSGTTPIRAFRIRVTRGYFETLRMPILLGRAFDIEQPSYPVAIVSQSLTNDPLVIGRSATFDILGQAPVTIVGVVDDVRSREADGTGPRPQVYIPAAQDPARQMTLLARTADAARLDSVQPVLQKVLAEFDAQLPTPRVNSLEAVVRSSMSQPRFGALVLTLLGLSATALALFALFGLWRYFRGPIV